MPTRTEAPPPGTAARALLVLSAAGAALGLFWAVLGSVDPWGVYDRALARALFDAPALPEPAARVWRFAVALVGATSTGFFVLCCVVVRHALADGATWAYRGLWAALLAWFVPDSALSLWAGVAFNVWAVNVPCLLLFGSALVAWRARPR
jgi:hypothetical protein